MKSNFNLSQKIKLFYIIIFFLIIFIFPLYILISYNSQKKLQFAIANNKEYTKIIYIYI